MSYYIVDRNKYPNFWKFCVGTYFLKIGVSPIASFCGLLMMIVLPVLPLAFMKIGPSEMAVLASLIFILWFSFFCSAILLFHQRYVVKGGYLEVVLFNRTIRKIDLKEITYIKRLKRWGMAYEVRWSHGMKAMNFFTDSLPDELEQIRLKLDQRLG